MSQLDEDAPQLGYVEPLDQESISHYLGRLRRFKANSLPSAYSLGQAVGIDGVLNRWEKLYFNPFPTDEELEALARLVKLDAERLREMFYKNITLQPRPIRLCSACYIETPCHRMVWQYKDIVAVCPHHNLRLLERCPSCKTTFLIPALWTDGKCHRCGMRFTSMMKHQERIKKQAE